MASGFRGGSVQVKSGRRNLLLATLLGIFLIILNIATGGKISSLVRDIASPLQMTGGRMVSGITNSGFFASRSSLEAQIGALQDELQQDQLQAAAYAALQQQNQSLSALEHLAQTNQGLAAPITSSVVSSPYGTFTIGAGSADKVATGALVLTSGGFIVGTISQVDTHEATVTQLFAPGVQTPVTVDGAAVVASGQGGQALAEIPHGISVSQGDPVIAPQLGARPIGIVQHVDSNPANAQQAAYIALPVPLSSLQYVYVTP